MSTGHLKPRSRRPSGTLDPVTLPLVLRPRRPEDLPELWRWTHGTPDPEWKRWDAPYFHGPHSPLGLAEYTARALARPVPEHLHVIEIGGMVRGVVTRAWEDPQEGGWMDLGIVIHDPAFWNGGYGTRALHGWVDLTFRDTPAHVLTLTTWSGNARMLGAARRLGFRECARVREARSWQGERYDSVRFDLLRREWATHTGTEGTAG